MRGSARSLRRKIERRPRIEHCEIFAPPSDLLGAFLGGSLLVSLSADAAEADSARFYRPDDPSLPAEVAAYFSHPLRFDPEILYEMEENGGDRDGPVATTAPFDAVFGDGDADHDWLRQARASFDAWLSHVVEQLFAAEGNQSAGGVIALRAVVVADDAGPRIAAWGFQVIAGSLSANGEGKSGQPDDGGGDERDGGFALLMMNMPPMAAADGPYMAITNTQLVVAAAGVLSNDFDWDGPSALTASLYSQALHGVVSLSANGSFTYMPATDYFGGDSFQYRAFDGLAYSMVAMASISVMRPTIDLDTDSNNNGVAAEGAPEDLIEMGDPGNIIQRNHDDDNGNGPQDRLDPAPFVNGAGQPVSDNDLEVATLSLTGAPNGFTVEIVKHGSEINLWKTADKQALPLTYTVGTNPLPTQFFIEGYDYGQATVEALVKNQAGGVVHRDEILVTVANINLVGYRPLTEGTEYDNPFPRIEVPFALETNPGIGIRKNGDDDDNDNPGPDLAAADVTIDGENDLIEIEMRIEDGGAANIQYVLRRGDAEINVFEERDKSGPLLDANNPTVLVTPPLTVTEAWVEWVGAVPGETELRLELQDARYGNTALIDSVVFKPFTSVVIAFGGQGAEPLIATNGPFVIAQQLYEDGYDVHAYRESDLVAAYQEVLTAVTRRSVTQVAIFGYSQGGGATRELAFQMSATNWTVAPSIVYTAYIDAVEHTLGEPEKRRPIDSLYHVNYWQPDGFFHGLPTTVDGTADFEVDVSVQPWGAGVDHYTIDNLPEVINGVRESLKSKTDR